MRLKTLPDFIDKSIELVEMVRMVEADVYELKLLRNNNNNN